MNEQFDPQEYLRQLPERIGAFTDDQLGKMSQEATEMVAAWRQSLSDHELKYQKYREAVEKYSRGERRTKPSPNLDRGSRITRSHNEMTKFCGYWIQYWQKKIAIIEGEIGFRAQS